MIDQYSNLKYDKFEVIHTQLYEGVFDKLQMFDKFRDGQNIFFSALFGLIFSAIPMLIRLSMGIPRSK